MSIGKRILDAREKLGIRQQELANMTEMNSSNISHFESGRRTPSSESIVRLARALGVTTDYLLGLEKFRATGEKLEALADAFEELSAEDQDRLIRAAVAWSE